MDRIEFKKFIQKCVTLHFDHIEAEDDVVVCYLVTYNGIYTLSLSKKANSSNLIHKQN